MNMQKRVLLVIYLATVLLAASLPMKAQDRPRFDPDRDHDRDKIETMWIDHLVFLPGDPSVQTSRSIPGSEAD